MLHYAFYHTHLSKNQIIDEKINDHELNFLFKAFISESKFHSDPAGLS